MSRFDNLTLQDLDALTDAVVQHLNEHGVQRTITQEILKERCLHYAGVARQELEACGPEDTPDSSDFCPTAAVFMADGWEISSLRVGFRPGQKGAMMRALSQMCKTVLAQAVILRIVATTANMLQIAEAMHLNVPDPYDRQKVRYFEERMWPWIEKNFGKQRLSALPPEFRCDTIMVGGMGPKLADEGAMVPYRWEHGKLICEEPMTDGEVRMEMIPRWWQ
jgi:hypothetical protein